MPFCYFCNNNNTNMNRHSDTLIHKKNVLLNKNGKTLFIINRDLTDMEYQIIGIMETIKNTNKFYPVALKKMNKVYFNICYQKEIFHIINLEELVKEAFKPSRVFYSLNMKLLNKKI